MAAHNDLGKWGEDMAARYLQQKGYVIVERNWMAGRRDLDIVALDGQTLVIVEVKTRRNRLFRAPEEAIDHRKRLSLMTAINTYVKSRFPGSPVRFDIVTVVGTIASEPEIIHMPDVALF